MKIGIARGSKCNFLLAISAFEMKKESRQKINQQNAAENKAEKRQFS